MALPVPEVGLVIRYAYVWKHEVRSGIAEGKERPAAIVLSRTLSADGSVLVTVAPVTSEQPPSDSLSVEIPADERRRLGLTDPGRSWIVLEDFNRFTWPGFDLRQIPDKPGTFAYGRLARRVMREVLELLDRHAATLTATKRD